jgi:holo-[acyl-carrier protein] synthase
MTEPLVIIGTGVDIVETTRIQDSLDRFGERFLNRCFWPAEIAYCQSMKLPALNVAARFAAKEAISKAFGTGIGAELGWRDMEICKRDTGEPFVKLHDKGAVLAKERGVTGIFVSLSHSKEYGVAQAIIIGQLPGAPE